MELLLRSLDGFPATSGRGHERRSLLLWQAYGEDRVTWFATTALLAVSSREYEREWVRQGEMSSLRSRAGPSILSSGGSTVPASPSRVPPAESTPRVRRALGQGSASRRQLLGAERRTRGSRRTADGGVRTVDRRVDCSLRGSPLSRVVTPGGASKEGGRSDSPNRRVASRERVPRVR